MRLSIITILSIFFCLGLFNRSFSQVAIGTGGTTPIPNPSAVLLLIGDGTQGLIIPTITNINTTTAIGKAGMVAFSNGKVYYSDGSAWNQVGGGSAASLGLRLQGNVLSLDPTGTSSIGLSGGTAPTAADKGKLFVWDGSQWTTTPTPNAANQILKWDNTNGVWVLGTDNTGATASLANGQIFVGNASNVATATAPSAFPISNFGAATSAVSMGNNKITNVATPTSPTDAANKSYVDANVLPSLSASQLLSNNGTNTGITVAGDLGLSVTGTTGTFTIANNSVTDAKVATGISGSKINPAFGSQNISTSGTLTSGAATLTALTVSGATTSLNNKTYTWPNNPTLLAGTFLQTDASGNLSWAPALGAGTVSSVGLSMPSIFTVTNSPVIAAGTLTASLNSQAANSFLASPSGAAGVPGFRTLVAADIPNLDAGKITTGTVPIANGGTNSTATPTNGGISYGTGTAYAFTTAGTAGQVLQSNGAAAPTWVNAPAPTGAAGGDLAGNYPNPTIGATATTGANVITSINAASTATINTARLNASVVLDTEAPAAGDIIGNFSTGLQIGSGVIANADISATAAIAATKLAAGTSGQILQTNGSLVPTWTTPAFASNTLTNSQIFVGNASNVATGVAMSGDATISNTGALTLANTAATRANLGLGTMAIQDKSAVSINGGTINGLTAPIDIGSGGTGTNSVTLNGVAYGAIGAINYTAPGTAGQLLQSNGATPPSWVSVPVAVSPVNTVIKGDAAGTAQVASQIFDDGTSVSIASVPTTNITKLTVQNEVSGGPNNTVSGTKGLRVAVADNSNTQVAALETRVTGANAGQQIGIFNSVDGTVGQNRGIVTSAQNSPSTNSAMEAYAQGNTGTNYGIQVNIGGTQAASKYGLFINAAGSGTKYGVYSNGEDSNYFSGSVGIGLSTPLSPLQITSLNTRKIAFFQTANNDHQYVGIGMDGLGTIHYQTAVNSNDHAFYTATSATTSNELMRIKGTGNVGIGTTTPASRLTVAAGASIGSGYAATAAPSNGAIIQGNVGIGASAPVKKLEVVSTAAGGDGILINHQTNRPTLYFDNSTTTMDAGIISGTATTDGLIYTFGNATGGLTFYMNMDLTGFHPWLQSLNLNLGTTSKRWTNIYLVNNPSVSSDSRLKSNIRQTEYGLKQVMDLRPVSYYLKSEKEATKHLGFIAQEVKTIIPEVVDGEETDQEFLSMRYSEMIPVLTKAIQELNTKIEALEKENNQLKGNNTQLQTEVASLKDKQVSEMEVLKKQMEEIKKVLGMEANAKKK